MPTLARKGFHACFGRSSIATEGHMYQPERLLDLWAAVCRQALKDYAACYQCPRHPDAGAFLRACGLMRDDGTLLYDGAIPRHQQRV